MEKIRPASAAYKAIKEVTRQKCGRRLKAHTFWNIPSMPGMLAACSGLGFTICMGSHQECIST